MRNSDYMIDVLIEDQMFASQHTRVKAYQRTAVLSTIKSFGEHIHRHLLHSIVLDSDHVAFVELPYVMVTDIDVLGMGVKHIVLGQGYCGHVVAMDRERSIVPEKRSEPNCFLCHVSNGDILARCFLNDQDTVPPPMRRAYLEIECWLSIFDPQSESQKPLSSPTLFKGA